MNCTALALALVLGTGAEPELEQRMRASLVRYADYAHAVYAESERHARSLEEAIEAFLARPSAAGLERAREAWRQGRVVYGRSEVLRFYDGPIDDAEVGVETLLNAWPLDENYIDAVEGGTYPGIVGDVERFPHLDASLLTLLNERGGEANISIGWHAIEFLLWGQDHDPHGPGQRSHRDYLVGESAFAARRAQYLSLCAGLLVEHLERVRTAWAPEQDNYRARFLADEARSSFRKVLAGMIVLSGFEMSGERLAVAYETGDQEEEHSCFSDHTHVDFRSNQEGVLGLWMREFDGRPGADVRSVALEAAPDLAPVIEDALERSLRSIVGMPVPFDAAIRGRAPEDPERERVLAALLALEQQAELLAALGLALGFEVAIQPGG